jgi:hypothetical protein
VNSVPATVLVSLPPSLDPPPCVANSMVSLLQLARLAHSRVLGVCHFLSLSYVRVDKSVLRPAFPVIIDGL